TAGTWEMYFDARDVGLTKGDEDVSGLELLPDGRLLLTTKGPFASGNLSGTGHDILVFTPLTLGLSTSGTLEMYFDGSDVGLDSTGEKVNGIAVDGLGKIYLTTTSSFSVAGVSGKRDDIFVFTPSSLGEDTAGTFDSTLFLKGVTAGLASHSIYGMSLPLASVAPTAHDQDLETPVDTPVGIVLTATDPDTPQPSLVFNVLTQPTSGALVGAGTGWTYTPNGGFVGFDSFTFQVSDDEHDSNIATISLAVGDVNDPPVAEDQSVITPLNTAVDFDLAASDEDTPPASLVYTLLSDPANGTLNGTAPNLTYTPDTDYTGSDSFTWMVNDGEWDSAVATVSIDVQPDSLLYFTLRDAGTVGSAGELTVESVDIVSFDGTTMSRYFDGSDLGLPSNYRIDALDVLNGSEILMSFAQNRTIPGIAEVVEDTDLVLFTATSLGENTAGSFELYLHGRDVGLASNDDDIDGIHLLGDGRLLVSTKGNFTALGDEGGLTGTGHDIIALTPTSLGADTAGSWEMYFDGTDVDLTTSGEVITGTSVDASGRIYMTTASSYSVPGLTGNREDIISFDPTTLGDITSGTYVTPHFLDGSSYKMVGDAVFALDIP
ncbi:MAG: Ig-like domain-containing protein, partial [Dehalococcoidia bacterium]